MLTTNNPVLSMGFKLRFKHTKKSMNFFCKSVNTILYLVWTIFVVEPEPFDLSTDSGTTPEEPFNAFHP